MAQDGLQFSANLTVTSSGFAAGVVQSYGFKATYFQCVNCTSAAGPTWVDFTGANATTSAGYPLALGETFKSSPTSRTLTAYYTTISAITSAGVTNTLRVIALA